MTAIAGRSTHYPVYGAVALALGVAIPGLCAIAALSAPQVSTPLSPYLVLPLEARATATVTTDPAISALQSRQVLVIAPGTSTAWLRIAFLRAAVAGKLDAQSLTALERSYEVAPLGPDVTPWRVRFVFEHWPELTPGLRAMALQEMRVHVTGRPDRARRMQIADPAGRLAAGLAFRMADGPSGGRQDNLQH